MISHVLRMVSKDLLRQLRAPVAVVVLLIFPLALTSLLGMAFGGDSGNGGGSGLPRIKVFVVDHDDNFLSGFVTQAADSDQFSEMFEMIILADEDEARRRMQDGEASALLVIPEGMTEDLLDGRDVELQLVKNPAQSILPQVVEETVLVSALLLDQGVHLLGEPVKALIESMEGDDEDDVTLPADAILSSLVVSLSGKLRPMMHYVFPPVFTFEGVSERDVPLEKLVQASAGEDVDELKARLPAAPGDEAPGEEEDSGFNFFSFLLPMVTLMAIMFIGENGLRDLLLEQKKGTLTRQFASPAGVASVLLSKVFLSFTICLASMFVLFAVGLLIGWVPSSLDLPGTALQLAATALASTGIAALIYGFVSRDRAATTTHSALVMVMSFLGGSLIPVQNMPAGLRSVAPFTVNYWGITGLQDLTVRGGGVADILSEAGVLALIGLVGIAIGWFRMSRRFAAGQA